MIKYENLIYLISINRKWKKINVAKTDINDPKISWKANK
jgi:hypothetical protein